MLFSSHSYANIKTKPRKKKSKPFFFLRFRKEDTNFNRIIFPLLCKSCFWVFLGAVFPSLVFASTSMEVEEEVKRVVDEVKELHDSAASFISSSSQQELSLRQKASAVDASVRRLHSTLVSDKRLDPKLVEKAFFF